MKKTILFLFLLSLAYALPGQVFDMTSSWVERVTNRMKPLACGGVVHYKLEGDTVINKTSYTKLYKNGSLYAALRESEENKLYALFVKDGEKGMEKGEILLYDFSPWEVGKTLYFQVYEWPGGLTPPEDWQGFFDYTIIEEPELVQLLDGNDYQSINNFGELIRGIGNLGGFFSFSIIRAVPADGSEYYISCFFRNGQLVYKHDTESEYCECEEYVGTENTLLPASPLSPNPAGDEIRIAGAVGGNVYIFNAAGQQVASVSGYAGEAINVSTLPPGVYTAVYGKQSETFVKR